MGKSKSVPRIFLSYAREDQQLVEDLYQKLSAAGCRPWMDTKDILPGERWMDSIQSAIEQSDFFLACLSTNSITKRGVLQREFKSALDAWQGMLNSDIYFIPVRLNACSVPESMSSFQWVDLFEKDGFSRLERALETGLERRAKSTKAPAQRPTQLPGLEDNRQSAASRTQQALGEGRMRLLRVAGISLGFLLFALAIPWLYNNYFYKVKRPIIPPTCQVSVAPVRVGVFQLAGCSSSLEEGLAKAWTGAVSDATIIPLYPLSGEYVRLYAGNRDILVWGECSDTGDQASLTFELTTSRTAYGVYEPRSLNVLAPLSAMANVGSALIYYQHGDYEKAAGLFRSLPSVPGWVHSDEAALFEANSWLFAEQYTRAILSYQELVEVEDISSPAALNNVGVAYFNINTKLGLTQFDQSLELARSQDAAEVEALALVNRNQFYQLNNDWENAREDCQSLLDLNGRSALPHLCLARYNMMYYRFQSPAPLPLNVIDGNLKEAQKYADAPPLVHYVRGYWHVSHFWQQKQAAVDSYLDFLEEMQFRACLQSDLDLIRTAKTQIENLTRP
ncbi:MAG: toll/interleukin-1 receptor domain-containing protein [Chloroflexota bacterium]